MEEKNLVVLENLDLVTKDDVKFLHSNSKEFLDRYRRRSLFRSRFEMDALVLNDAEHPTPDSKYWQAIGEQAVHVSELIRLGYNSKKTEAEVKRLKAEIKELESKKADSKKDYIVEQCEADIEYKEVEIDEKQYGQLEAKKVAQERIKEIRNWEDIIPNLEKNLKHGKEDWEAHHPERALLRTEWQMKNFDLLDTENRKNTTKFFLSAIQHPDNKELVKERQEQLEEGASQYNLRKAIVGPASDPAIDSLLDRKRKNLIIVHSDDSPVDFGNLRPPPGMQVITRTMPTVIVPDALKYAIDHGADMVYIVEDDIVPPVHGLMELIAKEELAITGVVNKDGKVQPATVLINIEAIRAIDALGGKEQELESLTDTNCECLYLDGGILKGNPEIVNENGRPIGDENFEKFNGTYLHKVGVQEQQELLSTEATMETAKPVSVMMGGQPKQSPGKPSNGGGLKLAGQPTILEQPKVSAMKDHKSKKELTDTDPIAQKYFDRKVRRIMVGAPHRLQTDQNVTDMNMLQMPAAIDSTIESPWGFNVADARNVVIKRAMEEKANYIFFIDDDTVIPRNALVQLFHHLQNNENALLAGGSYYRKYLPLESVPMLEAEDTTPYAMDGNAKIGEVHHNCLVLPSGCTLIDMKLFDMLEEPYYQAHTVSGRAALTEDTVICQKARDLGVDIILDTGIQCLHVDKSNGKIYGHSKIVNPLDNTINTNYKDYFAATFEE
jgi:hypothetical protein